MYIIEGDAIISRGSRGNDIVGLCRPPAESDSTKYADFTSSTAVHRILLHVYISIQLMFLVTMRMVGQENTIRI